MANEQNLVPIRKGQLSKEEVKRRTSNGGKKSGIVRRENKKLKEIMESLLKETITSEEGKEVTRKQAITAKVLKQALAGNLKAFELMRDQLNEKPVEKSEQTITTDWTGILKTMDNKI